MPDHLLDWAKSLWLARSHAPRAEGKSAIEHARELLELLVRHGEVVGRNLLRRQPENPHAERNFGLQRALWIDQIRGTNLSEDERAFLYFLQRALGIDWLGGKIIRSGDEGKFERLYEPPSRNVSMRRRDEYLVAVIRQLRDTYGVKPTRNRISHGLRENLSGCAIVAIVLDELGEDLSEDNVEKIWQRRSVGQK